jgi:CDP-diacylglycerol--glycerol-3-phosphate 3-phosphatidyltransferase
VVFCGVTQSSEKKPFILGDYLRVRFKKILDGIAGFLNRLGLMPNTITLLGLIGNFASAWLLATGHFMAGGLVVLFSGALDGLDGSMARLRKLPVEFGAFVDSVTDRYSELALFGGLLFYYLRQEDWQTVLGAYLAVSGSVLVSYIRARADAVGMDTKVGLATRFERYIVLVITLLFSIPQIGIWIIAVLANITALQRIFDVRRQAKEKNLIRYL